MSRQYRNPPLREAVCEFRFQSESPWDLAVPGLIYAKLRDRYPKRLPGRNISVGATIEIGPEAPRHQISRVEELRFWRDDDTGAINIRPGVLAVSHFKPYPSWDGFSPIINQALEAYKEVAVPDGFQRIGLRYVNEVEFQSGTVDLERYFDFHPFLGEKMPQDYVSFVVGIQISFNNNRDILRVQMSPSSKSSPNQLIVVLDLDYFLREPGAIGFDYVYDWLNEAHDSIGEVFEATLKDPLRDMFDYEGG